MKTITLSIASIALVLGILFAPFSSYAAHGKKPQKPAENPQIIILIGPPGSGKGTQAIRLSRELKFIHISSGDLLRDNLRRGTHLGKRAKVFMEAGSLVPDNLIEEMIFDKIKNPGNLPGIKTVGFILDGFPRNLAQANNLDKELDKKAKILVIHLNVSDDIIINRILERAQNKSVKRSDDTLEIAKKRLTVYHEQTEPLIAYYKEKGLLVTVDGTKNPEEVFNEILTIYHARMSP